MHSGTCMNARTVILGGDIAQCHRDDRDRRSTEPAARTRYIDWGEKDDGYTVTGEPSDSKHSITYPRHTMAWHTSRYMGHGPRGVPSGRDSYVHRPGGQFRLSLALVLREYSIAKTVQLGRCFGSFVLFCYKKSDVLRKHSCPQP